MEFKIPGLFTVSFFFMLQPLPAADFTYVARQAEHAAFTSSNTYIRSTFGPDGASGSLPLDNFRFISNNRLYAAHAFGPLKLAAALPAFLYNGTYDRYLRAEAYGVGDLQAGILYTFKKKGTAAITALLPTGERDRGLGSGAAGLGLSGIYDGLPQALFTLDAGTYLPSSGSIAPGAVMEFTGYFKWFAWTGLYAVIETAGSGANGAPEAWHTGFKMLQSAEGQKKGSVIYTLWTDLAGRNTDKGYGFTLGIIY